MEQAKKEHMKKYKINGQRGRRELGECTIMGAKVFIYLFVLLFIMYNFKHKKNIKIEHSDFL